MSAKILHLDYEGQAIPFTTDGWLHATAIAERYGKRLDHWLENKDTLEYIKALDEMITGQESVIVDTRNSGYLKTRRGNAGGTWLHPKLAVTFARWCNAKFSVWCDMQIDALIRGELNTKAIARRQAAVGYRSLCDALAITHEAIGKSTKPHHFMNEARLINEVITGQFAGRNRDQLTQAELELIMLVENRDVLLIGQGKSYAERKSALNRYVQSLRTKHLGGHAA
ncbi:KilA-N domain-containing protein [Pseudomonas cichorii]|uniref:KilA-N domain-containing protein n=1 Tax=Pseudomonas cichorii TaxID=36746 RepID=UPI0018E64D70|nr:KilA-N domain-containing protein [Pseudomonas cichorii]MBI6853390.1 KilA-N domain-containing protein [Pseudomonas cichorii]